MLRVFVHALTVVDKDYLLKRDKSTQPIMVQLSEKQKAFADFFFFFIFKILFNFKHLPKKMSLIGHVFPEIPAPKNMVR